MKRVALAAMVLVTVGLGAAAACPDGPASAAQATCQAQQGKTATAWRLWRELAASAPTADDQAAAAAQAAALEPRLARVVIALASAPPPGLVLEVDGAPAQAGEAVPVDPGQAIVRAHATDRRDWAQTLWVSPGATAQVAIPELYNLHPNTGHPDPLFLRHVAVLTTGAAAVIALTIGFTEGAEARSHWHDSRAYCDAQNYCLPAGQSLIDRSRSAATAADVLVGVGVAAAAASVVLWRTTPRGDTVITPVASPTMIGGSVRGRF